jgi:acyl-CoA synthetase (AMP-forming)/AMP-acid ligase II
VPVALISYSPRLTSLAEQAPDRPAITCGDGSITRSELESAANRLARDLLQGGAAEGDNEAGKVRRSALRSERLATATPDD